MRPVRFDENFVWGDPNTYWGDPSFQLEPGDPGYVPPPGGNPSPNLKPRTRIKKMPKADYIDPNDDGFAAQLITTKNAIGNYDDLLAISPARVAAQAADADYFAWVMECLHVTENNAKQWVAWKNLVRDGGTPPATGAPVAVVLPTAPTAVALGVEGRHRELAQDSKSSANYNTGIGEALGYEGSVIAGPDLATIQPVLKLQSSGEGVNVKWGWQGQCAHLDMIEIQVDRGGGAGFQLLPMDTTPNYIDTTAPTAPTKMDLPRQSTASATPAWASGSNEVSINVAP